MQKHNLEDYLKAILQIASSSDEAVASTGRLAAKLGVTSGTASRMVRILAKSGFAVYTSYKGAQLTDKGHRLAIKVLRNHRLLELFLVQVLGMEWGDVHDEAERLEHAVSERLIGRIDEFLKYPEADPHGDPIPRADGTFSASPGVSLFASLPESEFVIQRVLDQSPNVLQFLAGVGIQIGRRGKVVENSPEAEIVSIAIDGKVIALGRTVAEKILVSVER
jgi:DtxR family Mn-dependent transcriptional regulator